MIKAYLLLFLCLSSYIIIGQVSDDFLKEKSINLFKNDILSSQNICLKENLKNDNLQIIINEIFKNISDSIKFYEIYSLRKFGKFVMQGHGNNYTKRYTYNKYTGENVNTNAISNFNIVINSFTSKVINLDKCYFYILLNGLEDHNLTYPEAYNKKLRKNSMFLYKSEGYYMLSAPRAEDIGNIFKKSSDEKKKIHISHNKNINVFVKKKNENRDTAYYYNFTFNKFDNLINVTLHSYK